MAMTMHCDIVSAEEEIFSGPVLMVFAPAEMGEVGIAPRHTPLMTRLKPGEVRIRPSEGGEDISFFVSGGILEVQPHVVTVCTGCQGKGRTGAGREERRCRLCTGASGIARGSSPATNTREVTQEPEIVYESAKGLRALFCFTGTIQWQKSGTTRLYFSPTR